MLRISADLRAASSSEHLFSATATLLHSNDTPISTSTGTVEAAELASEHLNFAFNFPAPSELQRLANSRVRFNFFQHVLQVNPSKQKASSAQQEPPVPVLIGTITVPLRSLLDSPELRLTHIIESSGEETKKKPSGSRLTVSVGDHRCEVLLTLTALQSDGSFSPLLTSDLTVVTIQPSLILIPNAWLGDDDESQSSQSSNVAASKLLMSPSASTNSRKSSKSKSSTSSQLQRYDVVINGPTNILNSSAPLALQSSTHRLHGSETSAVVAPSVPPSRPSSSGLAAPTSGSSPTVPSTPRRLASNLMSVRSASIASRRIEDDEDLMSGLQCGVPPHISSAKACVKSQPIYLVWDAQQRRAVRSLLLTKSSIFNIELRRMACDGIASAVATGGGGAVGFGSPLVSPSATSSASQPLTSPISGGSPALHTAASTATDSIMADWRCIASAVANLSITPLIDPSIRNIEPTLAFVTSTSTPSPVSQQHQQNFSSLASVALSSNLVAAPPEFDIITAPQLERDDSPQVRALAICSLWRVLT